MTQPSQANYRSAFLVLIGCVAAAIIVTFAIILFGLNKSADTSAAKSDARAKVLRQQSLVLSHVDECLTANTPCSDRNLRKTAAVLSKVFDQDIAIAACADQPGEQTEKQIRACAKQIVKASRAERSR